MPLHSQIICLICFKSVNRTSCNHATNEAIPDVSKSKCGTARKTNTITIELIGMFNFHPSCQIIWSKRCRSALFHWGRLNTTVIHNGLQQGRTVLDLVLFPQLRLPALRPGKCSCFVYEGHDCELRRDILRTPWSSRPDIVFLLEN